MLVVDNIHIIIQYTYTHFFHMFLKVVLDSCYQIMWMKKRSFDFVLSNWNTQYSIELSVHKQPSVLNTTYTKQSRCELLKYIFQKLCLVSGYQIVWMPKKYIWNTKYTIQYNIERSQKSSVFNTTYTIQSHLKCPHV